MKKLRRQPGLRFVLDFGFRMKEISPWIVVEPQADGRFTAARVTGSAFLAGPASVQNVGRHDVSACGAR